MFNPQKVSHLDTLYDLLNRSIGKHELVFFLTRRIFPRLKNLKIPPDPVEKVVENDKYGKFGFCERCGIPLKWNRKFGWLHPNSDPMEYETFREDVELDPFFFEIDKKVAN